MKRIITFLLIAILALFLFSAFFFLKETKSFISRASVSQQSFSVDNSYLFVTPLRAPANGTDKVRVNVFVLNSQGLGVLGKNIYLGKDAALKTDEIQSTTDQYGKAVFDISSQSPGEYFLDVRVEDTLLPQKAHISFY